MRVLTVLCFFLLSSLPSVGQENVPNLNLLEAKLERARDLSELQPEKAIPLLLEIKESAIAENDSFTQAVVSSLVGNCHYYLSDDLSAIEYWRTALRLARGDSAAGFIAGVFNNLGNGYSMVNPDSAIYFYKKSIALYEKLGLPEENGDQFVNISFSFLDELNMPDSAWSYIIMAEDVFLQRMDTTGLSSVYAQMGAIELSRKKLESSLRYGLNGLKLSRIVNNPRVEEFALDVVRMAHETLGNIDVAYSYFDTLVKFQEARNDLDRFALVSELETRYEAELKEREIKNLEAQKSRINKANNRQKAVIISSIVGLCLLLFLGFQMIKEKKRSDELLLNILPVAVAEELKSTGKAKAQRYESVTVLFTDFKGFSALSEQMSAEDLVKMIDEYFSAFDGIIETYNLEKVKTIGDSYMAAGGIPEPTNEHAAHVVQAAIEMQMHVNAIRRKKKKEGLPFFETRIGVHTGPVVAGVVGIKKFAYDIWGDTVNTAARLEKASEVGQVNISESTYQLVKDRFNCTHRGKVPIKNMGEIDMYFVG